MSKEPGAFTLLTNNLSVALPTWLPVEPGGKLGVSLNLKKPRMFAPDMRTDTLVPKFWLGAPAEVWASSVSVACCAAVDCDNAMIRNAETSAGNISLCLSPLGCGIAER